MELWEAKQLTEIHDYRGANPYPIIRVLGKARVVFPILREYAKQHPNVTLGGLRNGRTNQTAKLHD